MNNVKLRDLYTLDFDSHSKALKILNQLSNSSPTGNIFSIKERMNLINEYLVNNVNHRIFVIYYNNEIVGMVTILIEPKIIHDFKKVCHVEDFVIDSEYRGIGIGKIVLEKIKNLAQAYDCYKIILDCSDSVREFYENCGYTHTNNQMSIYL